MQKYEILEHKADLKIRAFGKDKKELFLNSMIGMLKSAGYKGEGKEIKRKVRISSLDFPSLLVDFLSEILYLVETKKIVFEKIKFKKLTDNEIEGELIGRPLKRIGVYIKGVTYHDLEIKQEEDKSWQATILFDI